MMRAYARDASTVVLRHRVLMMVVMLATIAVTVDLYIKTPKGFFPQDDTGLIFGCTQASPDISFKTMVELQQQAPTSCCATPRSPASAPRSAARA